MPLEAGRSQKNTGFYKNEKTGSLLQNAPIQDAEFVAAEQQDQTI